MQIRFLILFAYTCCFIPQLKGQPATDLYCQTSVFYAAVGSGINRIQLNTNSITDLGVFAPSGFSTLNCVAYAHDITMNSTNRTLYSSTQSGLSPCTILRWTGISWDTVVTDSVIYHNAGGFGRFVYFQHSPPNGVPNDQCISRLNANGTLTKIFTDTTLKFTVADIAVDEDGNIFCFRGPAIGNTTEITVLNPNGIILNSFSTTLNNLTAIYGAMFLGGTLYLGQGTTNGQLFPVIFSGSNASLGTPLSVPINFSMKDLANCHDSLDKKTTEIFAGMDDEWIVLFPNPGVDYFSLDLPQSKVFEIKIYDSIGRIVFETSNSMGKVKVDCSSFAPGLFLVRVEGSNGQGETCFMKL